MLYDHAYTSNAQEILSIKIALVCYVKGQASPQEPIPPSLTGGRCLSWGAKGFLIYIIVISGDRKLHQGGRRCGLWLLCSLRASSEPDLHPNSLGTASRKGHCPWNAPGSLPQHRLLTPLSFINTF